MATPDPNEAVLSGATLLQAPGRSARGFVHLKTRADFVRVAKGRRFHAAAFSLQTAVQTPGAAPRFGLTVTKKIGGAVERNRIRRRLREALRTMPQAGRPGYDYVLVARREALGACFADLVVEIGRALRKIHDGRNRPPRHHESANKHAQTLAGPLPVRPLDLVRIEQPCPNDKATSDMGRGADQ